ncbi:MAG TPA: Hsp20/alpha crystallin family protein [Thermoplasmata archaeon]|nr:Hsp20/alpha crystallin family protein [Thermoplasmata archaeon]
MTTKIEVPNRETSESPGSPNDPFSEIDRLVSEYRDPWFAAWLPHGSRFGWVPDALSSAAFAPALADVEEKPTLYEIRADLPGFAKDQIDVRVRGDVVEIRAENATASEGEERQFLRRERTYRGYERAIRLPEPVLGDKVEARYENGTLTVSVPKANPVQDHKVPVA